MLAIQAQYKELLSQYLKHQTERNLYLGQNFSRLFVRKNITPEEVISIHKKALEEMDAVTSAEIFTSFEFLTEFMIQYGLALRDHKILLEQQEVINHEIELAAKVQNTMLRTETANLDGVDVGYLSVPAGQMNGDYVYFQSDDTDYLGVGVADVVGKGIPAALCMSMVKNGLDTLGQTNISPAYALDVLNRIVVKSIADHMFISMFYGRYDNEASLFTYASAGHEPALYYNSKEQKFYDLDQANGLLLGILPDVHYLEGHVELQQNDLIIIMTDGVTECRSDEERFLTREELTALIFEVKDEPPEHLVRSVYKRLEKFQSCHLRDDFTLAVIKKL